MALLFDYARAEPQTMRRGYQFRYDFTVKDIDANGDKAAVNITGYTVTGTLRQTESKDGPAVSSVTLSATVINALIGTCYVSVSASDTANATVGKEYYFFVYINDATGTGGLDVLYRIGKVKVVA